MPDNDPGVLARELREIAGPDLPGIYRIHRNIMLRAADYLESRAPVGVTVGEPSLTGLEVTEALRDAMLVPGNEPSYPHYTWLEFCAARFQLLERGEENIGSHQFLIDALLVAGRKYRAALQANGVSGSPTSPKQTSELEEALANGSLMK